MHAEMQALMQSALDGELGASEQSALQAHVQTCAECAAEWAALKRVHATLADAPSLAPSAGFSARVMRRVVAQQPATAQFQVARLFLLVFTALGAGTVTFLLSPLSGLSEPAGWAMLIGALLSLSHALAVWNTILMTTTRVLAALVGEGPLVLAGLLALMLIVVWAQFVAGVSPVNRRVWITRGGSK